MDTLSIAGGACIALGLAIAMITTREKPGKLPCVYCGAVLSPPEYRCTHQLGDGRVGS